MFDPMLAFDDAGLLLLSQAQRDWIGPVQRAELFELYHSARTALAGGEDGRHARLTWAVDQFCRRHPSAPPATIYKALTRMVAP